MFKDRQNLAKTRQIWNSSETQRMKTSLGGCGIWAYKLKFGDHSHGIELMKEFLDATEVEPILV